MSAPAEIALTEAENAAAAPEAIKGVLTFRFLANWGIISLYITLFIGFIVTTFFSVRS